MQYGYTAWKQKKGFISVRFDEEGATWRALLRFQHSNLKVFFLVILFEVVFVVFPRSALIYPIQTKDLFGTKLVVDSIQRSNCSKIRHPLIILIDFSDCEVIKLNETANRTKIEWHANTFYLNK